MLCLGSYLFLELLCCVRLISMPSQPVQLACSSLQQCHHFPHMPVIVSSLLTCLQSMADLMTTGLLQGWELTQEKSYIILEVPLPTEGPCSVICGECWTLHR